MAVNYGQKGDRLNLPVAEGKVSGDFDVVGDLPVVLLTDRDSGGKADCAVTDVFEHPVKGVKDAGNVAVGIGDKVYMDGNELNKDAANGKEYGVALGVVTAGATTVIPVRLKGC